MAIGCLHTTVEHAVDLSRWPQASESLDKTAMFTTHQTIVLCVTSKALGAFSPTHSKLELQNRGHVMLKSPSVCCHAYQNLTGSL